VSLDVDSTLSGIEGIDWLAARRSAHAAAQVAALTAAAMAGEVALDDVYTQRLSMVAPGRDDVAALVHAYQDALAPGAAACIAALTGAGVRVLIVSGGLRDAALPLALTLGIAATDVHAVRLQRTATGAYAGFDTASPLITGDGKAQVLRALADNIPAPVLHVGDGMTDAAARTAVAAFAAYTGFVARAAVVQCADHVLSSFAALAALVLGRRSP
jgi:phosphoserine phosphatase